MENGSTTRCSDKSGTLPSCAPLATGYVPFQQKTPQRYDQCDACRVQGGGQNDPSERG